MIFYVVLHLRRANVINYYFHDGVSRFMLLYDKREEENDNKNKIFLVFFNNYFMNFMINLK